MYNIEEEYMPRPKDRSTWPKTARTLEAQLAQERRIGGEYQKYMEYSRRRLARSEAKAKASKARMDAANKEAKANAGPSASAVEAGKEKETGWSAKEAPSTREWIERVQENKREIEKRRREGAAGASSSPSANLPAAAPASVSAGPTMGIESVSGTGVSAGPPTSRGRAAARGFMGANVPVSMPAPPPVAASLPSASQASAAPSAVYPSAPPTAPAAPPEPKGGALRIKLKLPANGGAGAEGSGSGSGSSSRAGGSTKGNASVGARSTAKGRAGASIAKRGPMAQRGATRAFVGRGRRVAFPQDEEEEDSEEEDEDDQEEEEGEEDDEDAEGDEDDDVDVDGEGDAEGDVDVDVESEDVEGEITFYRNVDVESEDSEDDDSEGGGKDRPARPLTTRQAVLASMVDSSHVSLDGAAIPGSGAGGRRKKQLTEMEMKLRREETARKRKNLSEKKLEDEKAETINRLLKKQTRPRARRTNTTDSVGTGSVTPVGRAGKARGSALGGSRLKATTGDEPDEDGEEELVEGEEGEGEEWEDEGVRDEPKPTWVRWVSRVVNVPEQAPAAPSSADSMEVDGAAVKALERRMVLSLSLPSSLVQGVEAGRTGKTGGGEEAMDVDGEVGRAPRVEGCAVDGCSEKRKYRLVRDWTRGACGMAHLKILEGMV
ncbi:hypothetical protein DFP72DRAFT_896230 [Ephemerocybe angulata]|uniref:INO80 complex subunit B-like conserved region domain-containing protein n=1 Tax=Ephemerocybe angulata TaxID=980116 RepID=A0A8H6I1J0_9AGAR|nr:hypothetical protein DFP72DRAFT_896230 [Tulosesus angulatus]